MKDDNSNNEGQPLVPDSGRVFAARRTIVKGMASAVPVVMTIGCGQALANNSNLECIPKSPQPETDQICIGTEKMEDPVYLRKTVGVEQCRSTAAGELESGSIGLDETADSNQLPTPNNQRRKLIFLDANGAVADASPPGYAVTASCYCSFMPDEPGCNLPG